MNRDRQSASTAGAARRGRSGVLPKAAHWLAASSAAKSRRASLKAKAIAATASLTLAAAVSLIGVSPAGADPYSPSPQTYIAQANSDITDLSANVLVASANITVTQSIATASPVAKANATVNIIQGTFLGATIPFSSATQSSPPEHTAPTDGGLNDFGFPPVASINALGGIALTHGAGTCPNPGIALASQDTDLQKFFTVAPGSPTMYPAGSLLLSKAIGRMGGITLGGVGPISLGNAAAFTNYDTVTLAPISGAPGSYAVQATSTAQVGGLSFLSGAVAATWSGFYPYVSATANGSPGGASTAYNLPNVSIQFLGSTIPLSPNTQMGFNVPLVGGVTFTLGQPTQNTVSADGTYAEITLPLLQISVQILPILAGGAGATWNILPMHAVARMGKSATLPGLQCTSTFTGMTPTQGPTLGGTTVTISGSNFVQGATSVTIGGVTVPANQVSVSADGTSLTFVTPPHAEGAVPVSITTPFGSVPAPSNFTYIPPGPAISGPANGSSVTTTTPTISGNGYPGSTITVTNPGGGTVCTATVSTGGTWSCTPNAALPPGPNTLTANQTTPGGNTLTSPPVTFTVAVPVLSLVKNAPAGGLSTGVASSYTFTLTNNGTAAATSATVVDSLPANLLYTGYSGANWTCTPALGTGPVTVMCTYANTTGIAANGGKNTALTINIVPLQLGSSASVTNYAATDPSGATNVPTPTNCTAANAPSAGCAAPVVTPVNPVTAVSRRTHGSRGTFDLKIDTTQAVASNSITVEPRVNENGAIKRVVFIFGTSLPSVGSVSLGGTLTSVLSAGTASLPVIALNTTTGNYEVTVSIVGVPNAKRLLVTLNNVNGVVGNNVSAAVGYLLGDVDQNRFVNSADSVGDAKRAGQFTGGTNFLFDVDINGLINSSDAALIGKNSGKLLEK